MSISLEDRNTYQEHRKLIVAEHYILAESIDDVSEQIDIYFRTTANPILYDVRWIVVVLQELLEIAKAHFQHEEAIMAKSEFPELIFHKRDHDYLIKSLNEFTWSLSHGTVPLSADTGVNLRSWLTYHIKKYDDAYVEFMEPARPDAGGQKREPGPQDGCDANFRYQRNETLWSITRFMRRELHSRFRAPFCF